jgi:hypothetical protein
MPEPIFMKLGMYIMAPEPIGTACFINTSFQSLCIPRIVTTQRLGKHIPAAMNTWNNRTIFGRVCLWLCLCIPLSLIGNSVKTFPWQWRIVGGVVFCVLRDVSKESRQLVLPRTSCFESERPGSASV